MIIIDFWNWYYINFFPMTGAYKRFENIKKLIESKSSIKTVILASYDISLTEYYSDTVWYQNSRKFLGDELFEKKAELCRGNEITNLLIRNWKCDVFQIAMHYEWEFKKYMQSNKIDNIYLCGQSWDNCVKNRPLGYESLEKFIDLSTNICVKDSTVKDNKNRCFIPSENQNWEPTDEPGIYKWNRN